MSIYYNFFCETIYYHLANLVFDMLDFVADYKINLAQHTSTIHDHRMSVVVGCGKI
jgi:hypothetical protein